MKGERAHEEDRRGPEERRRAPIGWGRRGQAGQSSQRRGRGLPDLRANKTETTVKRTFSCREEKLRGWVTLLDQGERRGWKCAPDRRATAGLARGGELAGIGEREGAAWEVSSEGKGGERWEDVATYDKSCYQAGNIGRSMSEVQ